MFNGFSPETFDFLWGIRMNNNREWFIPHKQQYVQTLYEPMKALGQQLFESFLDRPGNVLKISRIYRDARLHYPEPYKDHLWICIRQDTEWWAERPCLYFEIRPEGISYGLIWWKPRVAALDAFRQSLVDSPTVFLQMLDAVQAVCGSVTADCYKRPKPAPDAQIAPFFSWKGNIACVHEESVGENLFTAELGLRVRAFLDHLAPLYDYLNRFTAE